MTNIFGHALSGVATSDPRWPILRGKIVTKCEGHGSELAQSSSILYMGQAQQFSLFIFFSVNSRQQHGPSPTIKTFFYGRRPFWAKSFCFLFSKVGSTSKIRSQLSGFNRGSELSDSSGGSQLSDTYFQI